MTEDNNTEDTQENNTESKKQVINALVWAGTMLLSSYLMRDKENSMTMLFIMIGGFFVTSNLIAGERSAKEEFRCLMKKLGF